ncbi:MAG: ribosome-recycling factor [Candidatus Pacebacteria bacterium]|nr:ribosome-recycling factor [Candidatus Paceibacterota bacterium]
MPINQLIEKLKKGGEAIIEEFRNEVLSVRSNRPQPALIENIRVECPLYGSIMPLKQLATIQVNLPNSLIVQVWDKANVSACEKAIQAANLGVSTIVEGSQIRVILPPLSQERRDQIFQLIKKKAEDTKIRLRRLRDDVLKEMKELFEQKKISEDDKYRGKEEIDKAMEGFNNKIEEIIEAKRREIYE